MIKELQLFVARFGAAKIKANGLMELTWITN